MSLRETFEEYTRTNENTPEREQAEKKLATLVTKILEDLKDPQVKPDEKVQRMTELQNLLQHLPDKYYDDNADKILNICVDLCDKNVYKGFDESGIDLTKPKNEIKFSDKLSVNMIAFKTLSTLLTVVPPKELLLYVKKIIQKEHKNAQLYLLFCEIILAIINRIEKKEAFVNELLVDILRCLNPALRKYIKYKTKTDNKEYKNMPVKVSDFLNNFEKWGSKLIRNILKVLNNLIMQNSTGANILLIEDLVESGVYKSTKEKKEVQPSKLMAHYCVLFSLDLLEGLLDVKSHNYFTSDSIEQIIHDLYDNLLRMHPYPQDYILNYNNQIKYRNYNTDIAQQNERDVYHLPKDKYGMFTIYNSAGISYMVQRLFKDPAAVLPLSPLFKLKLLLPSLHILMNEVSEKDELKMSLMISVFQILVHLPASKHIENLNYFDVPLPLFLHSMLQFAGGFSEEKQKGMGVAIFKGLTGLLNENAQVELISGIVRKTGNHALAGYLINEFRSGIQSALKDVSDEKMAQLTSPFLQTKYINRLFETSIKESYVTATPDQGELLSCGLNIFQYIGIKFINAQKNKTQDQTQNTQNILSAENHKLFSKYFLAAEKIKKIVEMELQSSKAMTDQYSEEEKKSKQNYTVFLRQNQLFMLNDTLDKLHNSYTQFKTI